MSPAAGQAASAFFALTAATIFFAISGKTPSRTKEPIRPGERMPARESMPASCVPAFT